MNSLRAIVRDMLAESPPAVASTLTATARRRLLQARVAVPPSPEDLFVTQPTDGAKVPKAELRKTLTRIRAMYGAGLGFASLGALASVVRATHGVHWEEGSELEGLLASIDADISQAIQSSREELDSGRVTDMEAAVAAVNEIRLAVKESRQVGSGVGGCPFEQGAIALDFWKFH